MNTLFSLFSARSSSNHQDLHRDISVIIDDGLQAAVQIRSPAHADSRRRQYGLPPASPVYQGPGTPLPREQKEEQNDVVSISIEQEVELDECIICKAELPEANKQYLTCMHNFHAACISTWLSRNPTCPICRHPIVVEDLGLDVAVDLLHDDDPYINEPEDDADYDTDEEDEAPYDPDVSQSEDEEPDEVVPLPWPAPQVQLPQHPVGPHPPVNLGWGPLMPPVMHPPPPIHVHLPPVPAPAAPALAPPPPPAAAGGAPAPGGPINNQPAVGHHLAVPEREHIRVVGRAKCVDFKWLVVIMLLSSLLTWGLDFKTVIVATILSIVLRPFSKVLVLLWRHSTWRTSLDIPRPPPVAAPLTTVDMDNLMARRTREPVLEIVPPASVTIAAGVDRFIQRTAITMGLSEQVITGQLVLHGRFTVPQSAVDFRPTNYIGTTASRNLVEVCVSHIDNIHDQRTSLVFWSPEMVNQLLSATRYLPAAQRALELGPKSTRITDQQLQSTYYSEVQAGSSRVAMIRASGSDLEDLHARSTVLDFQQGSPSTPCMDTGIVPQMGAPFLLLFGMMLLSESGRIFMVSFCGYLPRLLWALL